MMSSSRLVTLVICIFLALSCAYVVLAVDYYVDPVAGSDDNSGLSSDEAFRTITHALVTANATPAVITIWLAPGVYSEDTNGETFPLRLMWTTSLLGAGPETTTICSNTGGQGILFGGNASERTSLARVEGVCLRWPLDPFNGDAGVSLYNYGKVVFRRCTFACDLRVFGCVGVGSQNLIMEDSAFIDGASADLGVNERAEVRRCAFYGGRIGVANEGYNLIEKCKIIGGEIYWGVNEWCRAKGGQTIIRDCLIVNHREPNKRSTSGIVWSLTGPPGDMPSTMSTIQAASVNADSVNLSLVVSNSVISGNGTGILCLSDFNERFYRSHGARISNCRLLRNRYGGIDFDRTRFGRVELAVSNCFLMENSESTNIYGAIHAENVGSLTVESCTVVNNSVAGIRAWSTTQSAIADSVLYGNPYEIVQEGGSMSVRYCCVEGGYPGVRNFGADPIFASGPLGDYYLSSVEAGQHTDSLCIDAGSTSASIAGVANLTTQTNGAFDAGIVDIGYHYAATPPTIEASIASAGASPLNATPSYPASDGGAIIAGADEAPVLGPGDTLRAQVEVANEGWPIWVDFYAAFVAADGTVFYITPDGLTTDFTPYAIDVLLDDGLHFGPASVFEFTLNEHVIPGDYIFAAAFSRAREPFRPIGSIATARFRIM